MTAAAGPPVAVYDVNVLLSGLIWRGTPYHCLELARNGEVDAVTCRPAIETTLNKLSGKFGFSAEQVEATLVDILAFCRIVTIPAAAPAVTADPEDDKILASCLAADADYLVTGDRRHLLPLGHFGRTIILPPAAFLALVGTS